MARRWVQSRRDCQAAGTVRKEHHRPAANLVSCYYNVLCFVLCKADGFLLNSRSGISFTKKAIISTDSKSRFLLIGGKPLNEPIIQYGPFVMNTQQEIIQALRDYNIGQS